MQEMAAAVEDGHAMPMTTNEPNQPVLLTASRATPCPLQQTGQSLGSMKRLGEDG